MFNNMEWNPANLPPAAVLIIKRLKESPLLFPGSGDMMPEVKSVLGKSLQQHIQEKYHLATRPARGFVPPDSEAVLFADPGEMLACYWNDVSRHLEREHWWWEASARYLGNGLDGNLERIIYQNIRCLPAALGRLSRWGRIHQAVQSLTPGEASHIFQALIRAYGGDDRQIMADQYDGVAKKTPAKDPLGLVDKRNQRDFTRGSLQEMESLSADSGQEDIHSAHRFPWKEWIPDRVDFEGLSREHACLLAAGLSLGARTDALQDPGFLTALGQLWVDLDGRREVLWSRSDAGRREQTRGEEHKGSQSEKRILPGRRPGKQSEGQPVGSMAAAATLEEDALQFVSENHNPDTDIREDGQIQGVITQIGGVLYLINLIQKLDLPGCFAGDWSLRRQLGPWGIVDCLGRALLGEEGDPFGEDPLWGLLARLDNRDPGEMPGNTFSGPDHFQLPVSWWDPADEEPIFCCWSANEKRLRVWIEDGMLLLDCPRNKGFPAAETQAREELGKYLREVGLSDSIAHRYLGSRDMIESPVRKLETALTSKLNPELAEWLAMVVPAVRRYLFQILQLENNDVGGLASTLFFVPGTIYATDTHVELAANLDAISLPVRLAGLDFDPGWVPELGRVVNFHFR